MYSDLKYLQRAAEEMIIIGTPLNALSLVYIIQNALDAQKRDEDLEELNKEMQKGKEYVKK